MVGAFLAGDQLIELALEAIAQLLGKAALHQTATEGAGQHPSGPAAILTAVAAVCAGLDRGGADSQLGRLGAARLTSAVLEFPTVQFCHSILLLNKPRPAPSDG